MSMPGGNWITSNRTEENRITFRGKRKSRKKETSISATGCKDLSEYYSATSAFHICQPCFFTVLIRKSAEEGKQMIKRHLALGLSTHSASCAAVFVFLPNSQTLTHSTPASFSVSHDAKDVCTSRRKGRKEDSKILDTQRHWRSGGKERHKSGP